MTHDRITPADLRDGDRVVARMITGEWRTCTVEGNRLTPDTGTTRYQVSDANLIYRAHTEGTS